MSGKQNDKITQKITGGRTRDEKPYKLKQEQDKLESFT